MICLTFDTDWVEPDVLDVFLERWSPPGRATFFLHRPFSSLQHSSHELCPHPVIENLLAWKDPVRQLKEAAAPGAKGVRPHSCVFSHMVGVGLQELGFTWVSQANNQYETDLRPLRHPWGLWELPIYYMDNMDFWTPRNWPGLDHVPFASEVIDTALSGDALYVFAFHPLHIALNTRTPDDYALAKPRVLQDGVSPFDLRAAGRGTATFYAELCDRMSAAGIASVTCSEALAAYMGAVSAPS